MRLGARILPKDTRFPQRAVRRGIRRSRTSFSLSGEGPRYNKNNTVMIQLSEKAISKVKEILDTQDPKPAGLRIAVVGGGCSGFSYSMAFENSPSMLDKTYTFDGLQLFIDQASMLYLDGASVDYVETLEGQGFKFDNPNVRSTCGCGSSFNA